MLIDGITMDAPLAVTLANLWLQQNKFALRQETPAGTEMQPMIDKNGLCPYFSGKVTRGRKGVECESRRNWYHQKCGKISDDVQHQ